MMSSFLMALDAILCGLVILAALDLLRTVHVFEHPILSLSFYLVAIGAFGLLVEIARGSVVSPWSVLLHAGVVLYAWVHRHEIFQHDWHWNGVERRRHHP